MIYSEIEGHRLSQTREIISRVSEIYLIVPKKHGIGAENDIGIVSVIGTFATR